MADDGGWIVIAWKFTRSGAVGPFSGVAWPAAGEWLDADGGAVIPCRSAVHACTLEDLPMWLDDELWRVQLRGPVLRSHGKLAAAGGRLLERVTGWDAAAAAEYAEACVERAAAGAATLTGDAATVAAGLVEDGAACARRARREPSVAPTMAAGAALCAARAAGLEDSSRIAEERAWQAGWLARRLGLRTTGGAGA
jgi:hypothetical protein